MKEVYKLYLKVGDNGYIKYGIGDMSYIRELLFDYLGIELSEWFYSK